MTKTDLLSLPTVSISEMQEWAYGKGASSVFISNASLYFNICVEAGINPTIAYAQYAKETKYGKFGGTVSEDYCNPCGLKNASDGGCKDPKAYATFKDWNEGIQAHVDHLALYAAAPNYPKPNSPDPKHTKYLYGYCKTVEELEGTWAMSKGYAVDLLRFKDEMEYCKLVNIPYDEYIRASSLINK